jgi:hypothetical protein
MIGLRTVIPCPCIGTTSWSGPVARGKVRSRRGTEIRVAHKHVRYVGARMHIFGVLLRLPVVVEDVAGGNNRAV